MTGVSPGVPLEQAYAMYDDALTRRDLAAVTAFLAGDFTATTLRGVPIPRARFEERLRASWARPGQPGTVQTVIVSETLSADQAEVVAERRTRSVSADSFAVDGGGAIVEQLGEQTFVETWRMDRGEWHLLASRPLAPASDGVARHARVELQSPRLADLARRVAAGDWDAEGAFWRDLEGRAPLVERLPGSDADRLVTFAWRGDADTDSVDLYGGRHEAQSKALARLPRTDVWYRTERLPATARDGYGFTVRRVPREAPELVHELTVADPLAALGTDWASHFELPDAPPQPHLASRPGVARGRSRAGRMHSARLGEDRTWTVHVPAGLDPSADPGLIVVFDGEAYGGEPEAPVPTPLIVDNLVAERRITPSVLVLVDNMGTRDRDLPCRPAFFEFVADELVPSVASTFGFRPARSRTVAAGSSFGGLAAAYCGLAHGDVFGAVLSQSGSYWAGPGWEMHDREPHRYQTGWMMDRFAEASIPPTRFWMEVGRFEGPDQVLTNRHLRSVLELRGHDVTYIEYDGGHSYACWRGSIADGLIALLGPHAEGGAGKALTP